jgi:hypothetical protein
MMLISPTKNLVVSKRRATRPFSYDTLIIKGEGFISSNMCPL